MLQLLLSPKCNLQRHWHLAGQYFSRFQPRCPYLKYQTMQKIGANSYLDKPAMIAVLPIKFLGAWSVVSIYFLWICKEIHLSSTFLISSNCCHFMARLLQLAAYADVMMRVTRLVRLIRREKIWPMAVIHAIWRNPAPHCLCIARDLFWMDPDPYK